LLPGIAPKVVSLSSGSSANKSDQLRTYAVPATDQDKINVDIDMVAASRTNHASYSADARLGDGKVDFNLNDGSVFEIVP